MPHHSFDVLIAGSGFGGSLLAWILASRGRRVAMFDPVPHPRFAIGESSTPIADMILADLATQYALAELAPLAQYGSWCTHYPHLDRGRKRGFSYFFHTDGEAFPNQGRYPGELLVAASSDDWQCDTHWYRADVDAFLAERAVVAGARLWAPARAVSVRWQRGRWQVVLATPTGSPTVEAEWCVDASGGSFARQWLPAGDQTAQLQTYSEAIYTHVEELPRWRSFLQALGCRCDHHPFDCDAAALHHVFPGGWMWQLRFDSGIVSVGVAWARGCALPKGDSPGVQVLKLADQFPLLAAQFRSARLARLPGRWIRAGRLQRWAQRAAGHRWVLLPHAYGFIDPLHSTGIAHTLSGVERLAHLILHKEPPLHEELWHQYNDQLHAEIRLVDALVHTAYANTYRFDRFVLAVMLYFTATVWYEMRRRQGGSSRAFLCADDQELTRVLYECCRLLQQAASVDRQQPSRNKQTQDKRTAHLEEQIRSMIRPFNTAGLLNPEAENMYRHTAAR